MITAIKIYLLLGFLSYVFFFLKGVIHPSSIISFLIKCLAIGPFIVIKFLGEERELEKRFQEKEKEKLKKKKEEHTED
jgi:hypothetical protein